MNVTERVYFLTAAAQREFVCDVKEKLRYFGAVYDTVHQSTAKMDKEKTYEPPDENFIVVCVERFRCAEVLILPDFIGEGAMGIHDTSLLSNMKCGIYARKNLPLHRFRLRHLTTNPTNSLTVTSSFSSLARMRCSSLSHWPPDFMTLFFLSKTLSCCQTARSCFKGFLSA